jgi:response regulator RpfG family c-di-GMP phosphodiesterase
MINSLNINSDVTFFQKKSQNIFSNNEVNPLRFSPERVMEPSGDARVGEFNTREINNEKMNIMIIDDDNRDIALFELLLNNVYNFEFSLLKYNNANVAFDFLQQQKPISTNLIIIDLYMPEINGNLMLQKLKSDANTKNIPVIVYSSISSCMNVVEASNLEAIAFFQKPLQTDQFMKFIR